MKILELSSPTARTLIKNCLQTKSLIPVIGAGFTKGCKTKDAKVPDGNEFKKVMIDSIVSHSERLRDKREVLQKRGFKGISEIYLNGKDVPRDAVKADIAKFFLQVDLPKHKRDFLNSGWPYVYTFNIDDAIEKNSSFKPVLPYLKISDNSRNLKCVYKVHGDASHEVIYDESTSLIFSSSQYIRALIRNESMLLFLKSDICENNLLFIGCSLDNEIDLMYAIAGTEEDPSKETSRIYVTRQRPDEIDQIDFETYKIDTILLVDDYDEFYRFINKIYGETCSEHKDILSDFSAHRIKSLPNDKDVNVSFLLKADASLEGSRQFTLPFYKIDRALKLALLNSATNNTVSLIKGRRFSGKTILLQSIASDIKNKKAYFFPSTTSISDEIFDEILNRKNSTLVFDSNVLDYEKANTLRNRLNTLKQNSVNILIACNPSEIDIVNTFLSICPDDCFFELDNRLNSNELGKINRKLSELGIINWKKHKNILDNTFFLSENYPDKKANIVKTYNLSDDEIKSIIIVSTFDKTYSSASRALNLSIDGIKRLVEKLHPLLDIETTSTLETHHHSRYKIIANSKYWLFKVSRDYYKNNGQQKVVNVIIELVKTFKDNPNYRFISDKTILFDNLNQIFGGEIGGAAHLILDLYEQLQPVLYDQPDYWLQRAKAIHKLDKRSRSEILDGIDYAKKAYNDGKRQKTINNAEFTTALLYGKLCKQENYKNIQTIIDGVEWFYSAISNHHYNKEYIDSMLEASRGKKGLFYHFCKNLEENTDARLLPHKDRVQTLLRYSKL